MFQFLDGEVLGIWQGGTLISLVLLLGTREYTKNQLNRTKILQSRSLDFFAYPFPHPLLAHGPVIQSRIIDINTVSADCTSIGKNHVNCDIDMSHTPHTADTHVCYLSHHQTALSI